MSGHIIPRTNYGIFFQHHDSFFPMVQYWRHTFQINIHNEIRLPDLPLPCAPELNTSTCDHLARSVEHINFIRRQGVESIQATLNEIYQVIPDSPKISVSRGKRSLLPFLGKLGHSLFGLATDNDIKTISQHIEHLEKHQNLLLHELQNQNFSSIMKLVDQRMNNAMRAVQFNFHALQSLKQSWMSNT